jgi:hypothetical protein
MAVRRCIAPRLVLAGLLAALGTAHAQPAEGEAAGRFEFAGYNKTLVLNSRSVDEPHDRYDLLINRTRLKLSYIVPSRVELHLEDDIQVDTGSYLRSAQARSEEQAPARRLWNLRSTWSEGERYRLRNDVYRAYAKLSFGDTDAWIGRQRVALGTGRLWSTLDLLNPLNPLQLERDEYVGVDALRVERKLSPLTRAQAIYAPLPQGAAPRGMLRLATHAGEVDVALTVAQTWGDRLAGVEVATQARGFGLRGELTATRPKTGRSYLSGVAGVDYAFANTLTLSMETYLSTQDPAERARQFALDPLRRQIQPMGTRYLGVVASYEFHPLLKGTLMVLGNLRDGSRFTSASLAWSLGDNLVLQGGVQRFRGSADTEYGRGQPLANVQLQWFF